MSESFSSSSPEEHPTVNQTDEEKPYHSKRPHKKSRTGCKNCKARKVKCDEARPVCRSCRLRKTECSYPAPSQPKPTPTTSTTATAATTTTTTTVVSMRNRKSPSISGDTDYPNDYGLSWSATTPTASSVDGTSDLDSELASMSFPSKEDPDMLPALIVEPMYRPAPAVDEIDMRLLWFYTTSTCSSFSTEHDLTAPLASIMRTKVVQHAFETPFLMHSLFALSSLHLQGIGSPIDPQRSFHYRAKSFEGYRKAVEEANPATIPALLANSLFLTALSSESFRDSDTKDLYIIDWMLVWRGIGLMIGTMGVGPLFNAGMNMLFYRPSIDLDEATLFIPNNLLFMVSSIPRDDTDYEDVSTYYNTLKYLGSLYSNLSLRGMTPVMGLRIITWFTFVPHRFVEIGREVRARVLVILAYYAMFLKLTTSIWWTAGIGDRTLRDIQKHLDPKWLRFIEIPLQTIGVDDRMDVARIILQDAEWQDPFVVAGIAAKEEAATVTRKLTWVDNAGHPITWKNNKPVLVGAEEQGSAGPTW